MVVLRLLAVFISAGLLSGCYFYGDYDSLKGDIRMFKAYLRAIPPPFSCQPPGTPQARVCYYKLNVEPFDGQPGVFKGHIPKSVVDDGAKECKQIQDQHTKDTPDFYCPNPQYYSYVWYGFKMHNPPDLKKDVEYSFINIPNTDYLKIGKPEEAAVPVTK